MSLGPLVRSMFGPYERQISEAYRGIYFDLDSFVCCAKQWRPTAGRLLEVGCGEGAVTERLKSAYPQAEITAIDISPRLGRLYQGPRDAVRFIQCNVQDIAAAEAGRYDLVVLCDVLHHVPLHLRRNLLDAIRMTLAPGGALAIKEWERNATPIHWLCYASDRWLTEDRISYMTRGELRETLTASFGAAAIVDEARFAPWSNNLATLVQP